MCRLVLDLTASAAGRDHVGQPCSPFAPNCDLIALREGNAWDYPGVGPGKLPGWVKSRIIGCVVSLQLSLSKVTAQWCRR